MDDAWDIWDAAEGIETDEDAAAFLNAILELNDPSILPEALGVLARARGMTQLAEQTGLGRESLYKSLGKSGNPRFSTLTSILGALGLSLRVAPRASEPKAARA